MKLAKHISRRFSKMEEHIKSLSKSILLSKEESKMVAKIQTTIGQYSFNRQQFFDSKTLYAALAMLGSLLFLY